jgi:hypothetical protein
MALGSCSARSAAPPQGEVSGGATCRHGLPVAYWHPRQDVQVWSVKEQTDADGAATACRRCRPCRPWINQGAPWERGEVEKAVCFGYVGLRHGLTQACDAGSLAGTCCACRRLQVYTPPSCARARTRAYKPVSQSPRPEDSAAFHSMINRWLLK